MAANPRQVITDTDVNWDGGTFHVLGGTIVDIPGGSALEDAYGGPANLVALSEQDALTISNGATGSAAGEDTP